MRRYLLAPEAALDLVEIWRFLKNKATVEIADRKIVFLARMPGAGHWRKDLTDVSVRFFAVYSYLIVYRPETKPLQVVAILHGNRDVGHILSKRT